VCRLPLCGASACCVVCATGSSCNEHYSLEPLPAAATMVSLSSMRWQKLIATNADLASDGHVQLQAVAVGTMLLQRQQVIQQLCS